MIPNKALNKITEISDDEGANLDNYLDALNYIDNIYRLERALDGTVSYDSVEFLPSFKGKYVVERLGIASTADENELRCFKMESEEFYLNETLVSKIIKACKDTSEKVSIDGDIITIILKK